MKNLSDRTKMDGIMRLKESVGYWEHRLKLIEGKKDPMRVENVRRHLRMLKEAEGSGYEGKL